MMTRMNKFNITFCTNNTKIIKKTGASEVPQVCPWMQLGGVSMQSYISMFQFSPVDITNRVRNELPKSLKFLMSEMMLPSVIVEKKNTARIEKMNRTSISSRNTFESGPTDNVIVCISACKSLFFLASFIMRVTRSTLRILAIYGPTDNASLP
jgi:hypothetical protein